MALTPSEQLQTLRETESLAKKLKHLPISLTFGCWVAGYFFDFGIFYILGAFIGLVTLGSQQVMPNIRNALNAVDHGTRKKATVIIAIDRSSDSDSYHATVPVGHVLWSFEFIPQGWQPHEGSIEADVFHIDTVEWPVLLMTGNGLLVPRDKPKKRPAD